MLQTQAQLFAPRHARQESAPKTAIWCLDLGGSAAKSSFVFRQLFEMDQKPFPLVIQHIDTDPSTGSAADITTMIDMDVARIEAICGSPERFGRHARTIVERLRPFLQGEVAPGARTVRQIAQLFANYHRDQIAGDMRRALSLLVQRDRVRRVLPILKSSSGGGTGSALSVLLMQQLRDRQFQHDMLMGLQIEIERPVVIVTDPYGNVRQCKGTQARRIQSNMYAFRLETDHLLHRQGAAQLIFHLGLSNSQGVVLDDPQAIATVLGHASYAIARDWLAIASALCDGAFNDAVMGLPYAGLDTLERVRPDIFSRKDSNSTQE